MRWRENEKKRDSMRREGMERQRKRRERQIDGTRGKENNGEGWDRKARV